MRISHSSKVTASVDTGLSYWYLFKHGLGPGTMPKGVNVLKVIDDGWKDYVLLDQMLTTEELNEYEIKEATPPDDLLKSAGYSSIDETYQEFGAAIDIVADVPAPFDEWYEIDNSNEGDEFGRPSEEIEGYEAQHLAWVKAKDEYFDALSNNGLEYCELVSEGGEEPFLAQVISDRLIPLAQEEVRQCVYDDDFENIDSAENIRASWDDDTMSANVNRYYVTPDMSDNDIEFAAESVARYLQRRNLEHITTEDVIEELRSLSDIWEGYWAYGLRTREQQRAFLDDLLNRLANYGIDNVVNNTFEDVNSAEKIEASRENPNIFNFYEWYDHLSRKNRNMVDDWADEEGYPMYDECSQVELSNIMDHFGDLNRAGSFHVAAFGNEYNELQDSDDFENPRDAIKKWVQLQQKYPLDVMITGFAEQEQALRDYVVAHPDWIRELCKKYNCPYDPEYLIAESEKPSRMKPSEYTDQLHPFGLG